MTIERLELEGLLLITPDLHRDRRGAFLELHRAGRFGGDVPAPPFVQDNLSVSAPWVLRGLHFQDPHPQGKLVTCLVGDIFDVAVDLRPESPTRGQWAAVTLRASAPRQLYIPPGFAHGFLALKAGATVLYKVTAAYHPEAQRTQRWDDPELAIDWPLPEGVRPILSKKDGG